MYIKQSIFRLSKLSIATAILLNALSLLISSHPIHAAGSTDTTTNTVGTLTPTTGTNVTPTTTYNPASSFSYSQQFSGYGTTNGCGTQFSIGTNYGNSNSPYSTTTDNTISVNNANTKGYTIGANLIFNSQPCTDPNKTIQLQQEQITVQKAIACNQERSKIATLLITQNPKITPIELDNMLKVVCS
ncbi:MAG: hypothetical protein H7196_05165 [candidate division SR1 bacterium]|nr:hypothetical protein [candidate division SR1 bacterium]